MAINTSEKEGYVNPSKKERYVTTSISTLEGMGVNFYEIIKYKHYLCKSYMSRNEHALSVDLMF